MVLILAGKARSQSRVRKGTNRGEEIAGIGHARSMVLGKWTGNVRTCCPTRFTPTTLEKNPDQKYGTRGLSDSDTIPAKKIARAKRRPSGRFTLGDDVVNFKPPLHRPTRSCLVEQGLGSRTGEEKASPALFLLAL